MAANQVWASVVVRRPIQDVWEVISDAEQFERWCEMFWFEGGPFEEGQRMTLVLPLGLIRLRVPVVITRFDKEDELRWEAKLGFFRGSHWLRIRSLNEEQTQISHGEDYDGLRWIWPRIRHGVHAEYQKAADALAGYLAR